jgi:nitrogen regulatory protein PII
VKLILAIIQPTKLDAARDALVKIGVERMTVCDAQGYGRQRGQSAMYRGLEYKTNLLRKIALEIVVNDDFLERTLEALVQIARTGAQGEIGDGKIFISARRAHDPHRRDDGRARRGVTAGVAPSRNWRLAPLVLRQSSIEGCHGQALRLARDAPELASCSANPHG